MLTENYIIMNYEILYLL